jgi:hypothetical protein
MVIPSGYPYRLCTSNPRNNLKPLVCIYVYRFTNRKNYVYICHIEEYENNFFAIKFYLQSHRLSRHRYNKLTNQNDARRVIFTCINIGLELFKTRTNASFGFLGMPTISELSKIDNEKFKNTKRYRVYTKFAAFFFNPDKFSIHLNSSASSCLLLNREQEKIHPNLKDTVIEMFDSNYFVANFFS